MQLNNPNRLIQALCRSPEGIARLTEDCEAVFNEYELTDTEKEAMRSSDTLTLVSKGDVHPMLAMHYLIATNPKAAESMTIREYPGIKEEE